MFWWIIVYEPIKKEEDIKNKGQDKKEGREWERKKEKRGGEGEKKTEKERESVEGRGKRENFWYRYYVIRILNTLGKSLAWGLWIVPEDQSCWTCHIEERDSPE